MIILSTILITLALVFYSLGIWAERIAKILKAWHVVTFWIGFSFDLAGTTLMHIMAKGHFSLLDFHTLTGQLALWLMLAHAIWATRVVKKGSEDQRRKFHRYSVFVWLIWLIPYLGGAYIGMTR